MTTLNLINLFKDKRSHLKWPSNPLLNGDTSDVVITLKAETNFRFLPKLSFRFRPEGVGNSIYFINRHPYSCIEFN